MPELENYKQEYFAQRFAEHMDFRLAAKETDYTENYGYELLKKPHIRDRVKEIQRGTADRMVIGQNRVLRESAYLAFSDITELLHCSSVEDFKQLPQHVRKAIAAVDITETTIKHHKDDAGVIATETKRRYKIRMHGKAEPLKLLSTVTGLLDLREDDKEQLAFTGIDIIADITAARKKRPQLEQLPDDNQEEVKP